MINLNKKTIGIILIILLIIITIVIIINVNKGRNVEVTESGNIIDSEKLIEFEDFDIDVPEDYKIISGDSVQSYSQMYAKAIAFKYDEEKGMTYMNVYLQNRGDVPFYKDAVCTIKLFDANENNYLRTGGVIEEDENIPVGGTTIVKTQFYDEPGSYAYVVVDFENNITIEE